ncbi:MAG: hypothetical protein U0230_10305 [Polyangiales bacterium]
MSTELNAVLEARGPRVSSRSNRIRDSRPPRKPSDAVTNPIETPEQLRFVVPERPTFPLLGSITSVLSLVLMSTLSTGMFLALYGAGDPAVESWLAGVVGEGIVRALHVPDVPGGLAAWTWLPFLFTIFGSTLGWLFELGLILSGTPFEQTKSPLATWTQRVRFANLAPVTTTIFFFVVSMTVEDPTTRTALLVVSTAACAGLGFALFLAPPNPLLPVLLLGTQVLQAILVLGTGIPLGGHFLLLQALLQLVALVVGTATPRASTIFHVLSTLSGVMLYAALLEVTAADPAFSREVAIAVPAFGPLSWGLVVASVAGLVVSAKVFPLALSTLRVLVTNAFWVPIYFKLVSADRFPDPKALDVVYRNAKPKRARLVPYSVAHPTNLSASLSIPALLDDELEANATIFTKLLAQAKSAFSLIAFLDHNAPQANVDTPLEAKLRMQVYEDGSPYWPSLFGKELFGATLPEGGRLEAVPETALRAFESGQLLAYLTEFGIGSSFAKPAPERGEGALVSDFRFLEKYETKADYEPYGGAAYFRVDPRSERLLLESVVAPGSTLEIPVDPADPAFRQAEALVTASLYYQVISGKHLAEIHMTYNLVEVSMHNAFDAAGQWNHPFRTFLYLHFFSHELAEELTTEHLVQDGAVFSQIFATTHDALVQHLNDCYSAFEYGEDEDFEARTEAMRMPARDGSKGALLPHCSVSWELEYFDIFHAYAAALVEAIYPDDAAVVNDRYLQDFHRGLLEVLVRGLPDRYDGFRTKKGIARFAADTIHHATVRHQIYGTTGIKAALDPRLSKVQVPKDGGTSAIEEWRSLAYVALATGQARFTLLTGTKGKDFRYLLEALPSPLRDRMGVAFEKLQTDLQALEAKWTSAPNSKSFNYEYLRALPSELHTGPGY